MTVYSDVVEFVSATERKVISTGALSVARAKMAAVSLGPYVILAGGVGDDNELRDTVDIYDSRDTSWGVGQLSQPRQFPAAGSSGNSVYFAGACVPYPGRSGRARGCCRAAV